MLAFRILTTLLVRDGLLVKGKQFKNDRRVGSVFQAVNVFQQREIDEMFILDVDATRQNRMIDYKFVDRLTSNVYMPLGFGGGIKSVDDVKILLEHGADKIVLGSHATEDLINEIAKNLGSQSVCVSCDCRGDSVFTRSGSSSTGLSAVDFCRMAETAGAGEILLQSIEREGTMQGYDMPLIESICNIVSIPVVASGGAKDYDDFFNAYQAGCSGASAGAMYQFTERTPKEAKEYLKNKGVPVR